MPGTRDTSTQDARSIVTAVLQLGRRLRAQRPAASVTLSQLAVLATLQRLGPMPGMRLAAHERLQPQSLTRLLAELSAKGLIARRRGRTDRRTLELEITRKGQVALARDMRPRRRWLEAALRQQLSPTERDVLRLAAGLMVRLAAFEEPGPHLDAGPDE
jgi:DNA-binding MarR family transcriptional regulator